MRTINKLSDFDCKILMSIFYFNQLSQLNELHNFSSIYFIYNQNMKSYSNQ